MRDSSVVQVVIFREGSLVGTEVFLPGAYTVGSDEQCELLLTDEAIAACHAVLTFKDGRVLIEDLSGQGVSLNGTPQRKAEVSARDDLTIGPFLLKVRIVSQKRPATAQASAQPAPRPSSPAPAPSSPARSAAAPMAVPPAARPQPLPARSVPPVPASPVARAPVPAATAVPARSASPSPVASPPMAPGRPFAPRAPPSAPAHRAAPSPAHAGLPSPSGFSARTEVSPLAPAVRSAPTAIEARPIEALRPLGPRAPQTVPHSGPQPERPPAQASLLTDQARTLEEMPAVEPGETTEPEAEVASFVSTPAADELPLVDAEDLEAAPEPFERSPRTSIPAGKGGAYLRVRVFWGRRLVGIHGFRSGDRVVAGPGEKLDVPLYGPGFPGAPFELAAFGDGLWSVLIPKGVRALVEGGDGWEPVAGLSFPLAAGTALRLASGNCTVELRPVPLSPLPPTRLAERIDPRVAVPFVLAASLVVAGLVLMPEVPIESPDFSPKQLAPIRALLKPPPKKEEKKIKEKIARLTRRNVETVPSEAAVETPRTRAQNVNRAIKAVEKVAAAGPAVESLLKATSKMAGGPKGWGDKGQGFKLSPLTGKPPIAMAGMGVGPGAGGFGTQTKGLGGVRGMGGGSGGGIGVYAPGGVGKGKVAGTVVSAPARRATVSGGTLPRELVAKVINEHMQEVRGCYERALLKDAGLTGKLLLEWTIDTRGKVSEIRVKTSTLKGPEVPNCIVGSLKTWTFPSPKGGRVIVSYPFLFHSVGF